MKKAVATPRHCDDHINDSRAPHCLRVYLIINRLPAMDMVLVKERFDPTLFATHNGRRVRITMASRLGDVGISPHLDRDRGYETRVFLEELTDFSEKE